MQPNKPQLMLNIGATGHRHMDETEKADLYDLCNEIFVYLNECVGETYQHAHELYSKSAPKLNIFSSLAEGFDRIAAEASLQLGYNLQCPLPFLRDEYIKDFKTEESKLIFNSLLARASSVYEIDFDRNTEKSYFDAGSIMLEHIDILLAFWDGFPANGPGGTGDIVELAKEKNIPVICINRNMQVDCEGNTDWKSEIRALIKKIIIPSERLLCQENFPLLYFNEKLGTKHQLWIYNFIIKIFSAKCEFDNKIDNKINGFYNKFFEEADELAIFYANKYRSAGVLKALIPLLANIGLAIGFYWKWGDKPDIVNVIGFLVQAVSLYWLVTIVRAKNEKNKWHQKFIDYRILAECLRHLTFLMPVGITLRELEIQSYNGNESLSWINWYLKSLVKGIGLPNMVVDKNKLSEKLNQFKEDVILKQIDYHEKKSKVMKCIGEKIQKIGVVLFTTGAIITVFRVVIHYACQLDSNLSWFPNQNYKLIKVPNFFNMLSLLFPAFGSVMFALATQLGFEQLGQRHMFMKEQLEQISKQKDKLNVMSFFASRKWIYNVVTLLINEVSDWRIFIKGKGIAKR